MAIEFINADLEIYSDRPLGAIQREFNKHGDLFFELYCGEDSSGPFLARYEVHPEDLDGSDEGNSTAEQKIATFCAHILNFDRAARELWDSATKRVIDVGYQSDNHCRAMNDSISTKVLSQMNALDIQLAITIYPNTIRNEF